MSAIANLSPTALWSSFADLNAVPRPSKKEERVIQFMMDFGSSLGLETIKDHIGNVIIKKGATSGMEDRQTIVMQSHLDMVHQKNADTDFDFDKEGIKMLIEEDWVKADGTTLGADNGIGVATIMALLKSSDIDHPAIEALFTIDEETGMTGALDLQENLLDGSILLNLDTEDDRELTIGCAGGIDITCTGEFTTIALPENIASYRLSLTGLSGGHSGMDIHLGLGNANKLMNRILTDLTNDFDIYISSIEGGSLRNAIPRESFAIISSATNTEIIESAIDKWKTILKEEYNSTDPEMNLSLESIDTATNYIEPKFASDFIKAVYACWNGIYRLSPDVEDLVQTSNNLARVSIRNGQYEVLCLTRSSVDTEKTDLAQSISAAFSLIGAEVNLDGSYPGWTPKPTAPIIQLMRDTYVELFNEEPHVNACHAGLECGIIGSHYPNLDMISFGPNIRGAHSPDEKVQISSVQKYWKYLLEVLKNIPKK